MPEPGRGGEAALPEPAPTWAQPAHPLLLHHLQQALPHLLTCYFHPQFAGAAAGVSAAVSALGRGGEVALPEPAPNWDQPDRPCPLSPPPEVTFTPSDLLFFLVV